MQLAVSYPPLLYPSHYFIFSLFSVVCNFFCFSTGVFHANLSVIKAEVEGTLAGSLNPPGTKISKLALQAIVNELRDLSLQDLY